MQASEPIVVEHHVGADVCPPGTPNGIRKVFGARVKDVAAGATVIFNFTTVRQMTLTGMSIPPQQGPQWLIVQVAVADNGNITAANLNVTGGTADGAGVSGSSFASWGICASSLQDQCLPPAVPLVITAINKSVAAASLNVDICGVTS